MMEGVDTADMATMANGIVMTQAMETQVNNNMEGDNYGRAVPGEARTGHHTMKGFPGRAVWNE